MVALKEDAKYRDLKKEVEREIGHLRSLYSKLDKYEREQKKARREPEEHRIKRIEAEMKKKFPNMEFDRKLLKLVGALPFRNPPSRDNELISRIIAEHHE